MAADDRFQGLLGHIASLDHNLLAHHNGWRRRQIQSEIVVSEVLRFGLGYRFDLDLVLLAQPGHQLLKMHSRFAVGLVEEESHLQHSLLHFVSCPFS